MDAATKTRTVVVAGTPLTIVEAKDVDAVIDRAIDEELPTPYGAVTWTTAIVVAERVSELAKPGVRVLDVGVGTGLVLVTAAKAGAKVTGIDIDPVALQLARETASANGCTVSVEAFDITTASPLPQADVVVFADLLYEIPLAQAVAARVVEAVAYGAHVIVGDPRRDGRAAFLAAMAIAKMPAEFVDDKVSPEGEVPQFVGVAEFAPWR